MFVGHVMVIKERTVGHRTVMGTDWPLYRQLIRTNWKLGSCVPKFQPIYEVRGMFRDAIQWQRQFTSRRAAEVFYHKDEPRDTIDP